MVRQFAAMCLYNNPLTARQVQSLVNEFWPDRSLDSVHAMLGMNCEGSFRKVEEDKWVCPRLPRYWKDVDDKFSVVLELVGAKAELPEFLDLAVRRCVCGAALAPGLRRCADCRSRKVAEPSTPVYDASALAARDIWASTDNLAQLAFSIASSITERKIAEVLGPAWEAIKRAKESGIDGEAELRHAVLEELKRHWNAERDYHVVSLQKPLGQSDGLLVDVVPNLKDATPDDVSRRNELFEEMKQVLRFLPERHVKAFTMLLDRHSLSTIADDLGVSEQRAAEICEEAGRRFEDMRDDGVDCEAIMSAWQNGTSERLSALSVLRAG